MLTNTDTKPPSGPTVKTELEFFAFPVLSTLSQKVSFCEKELRLLKNKIAAATRNLFRNMKCMNFPFFCFTKPGSHRLQSELEVQPQVQLSSCQVIGYRIPARIAYVCNPDIR